MRFASVPAPPKAAFAAVGTADALRATRRQCCNFGAAAAALAPGKALANDALLEDAFSARTKVLRPLQSGTCDAPTPDWLEATGPSRRRASKA